MKNITLLAMAAAMCCAMGTNAQTRTTLWEGATEFDESWSGNQIIGKVADAKAGDKLILTAKSIPATNWEWGSQIFVKTQRAGWAGIAETISVTSDTEAEYTVEITADLTTIEEDVSGTKTPVETTMLAEIKEQGVVIQGIDAVLTKVELESSLKTTTDKIWEGSCTFGNWENGFSVAADVFEKADVKAGDVLEFIYTTDDTNPNTWWQIKTIYSGSDPETALEGNASDLNEWYCATVAQGSTKYKITLTETDATELKASGMYVNGYYLIVTQVNLIQTVSDGIEEIYARPRQHDNIRYNLSGQRVDDSAKVYILNGKLYRKR